MMHTSTIAVIHPLWPAASESAPGASGFSIALWIGLGLTLALLVGAVVSWLAWRDRRRHAPVERAFRSLARRLRLGRARAEMVRVLADDRDMPPVALLISQHAFDRAAANSTRGVDAQILASLRHHIFNDH